MSDELKELLDAAKNASVSSLEYEEQRLSFAFGNTHFENESITREMVQQEAEMLKNNGHS